MAWFDSDGLYRQYGTEKAVPTTAGDFSMPGELRVLELNINLASLTTSPVIQANTTVFGEDVNFIEQVEFDTEVAGVGGTSFSVGLIGLDRSTIDSNTKFINGALLATHDAVGEKSILTTGSTGAGSGIGTVVANPGYITALAAGTYSAGRVKVRIKYRGLPPITR